MISVLDVREFPEDHLLLAALTQGLRNRTSEKMYLISSDTDEFWLDLYRSRYGEQVVYENWNVQYQVPSDRRERCIWLNRMIFDIEEFPYANIIDAYQQLMELCDYYSVHYLDPDLGYLQLDYAVKNNYLIVDLEYSLKDNPQEANLFSAILNKNQHLLPVRGWDSREGREAMFINFLSDHNKYHFGGSLKEAKLVNASFEEITH